MTTAVSAEAHAQALDEALGKDAPLVLPLNALDLAFARFLHQEQPSANPNHALLAALASHQFGLGHACLDLQLLAQQGVELLGWEARFQPMLPNDLQADPAAAAATLPWAQGEGSPLVLQGPRLYLRRNWQAEQAIAAGIRARLQQPCAVPADLPDLLNRLFPQPSATGGVEPPTTDWQKIACALAARRRFTLITGGPGTGKTTTVVRLLALLQAGVKAEAETPLRVALAAPTGKAAARLGESIASALQQLPPDLRPPQPPAAQTLHKLLQIRQNQPDAQVPALAVDLVIVDEASMIDLEMMARLLAAVPLNASLILLGDKDQLASVEAGAVMAQLCDGADAGHYSAETVAWLKTVAQSDVSSWADANGAALAQQTAMLRFSRRFSDDSGIGIWARAVNAGDRQTVMRLWNQAPDHQTGNNANNASDAVVDRLQPRQPDDARLMALARSGWAQWLEQLEQLKQLPQPPQPHAIGPQACSDAQALALLQAFAAFQMLCAVRDGPWGVDTLNRRIATGLGFQDAGWYAGRPVMVSRNDYALGLMNGDVGLCLPHAKGLRVAFPDGQGGVRWVNPTRLDAVESVFAMTVHKSQGSEFAHVCLVLPDKAVAVLTRELLYTGITRAKSRLTLVLPQVQVLGRAVDAQVLRSGGLGAGI